MDDVIEHKNLPGFEQARCSAIELRSAVEEPHQHQQHQHHQHHQISDFREEEKEIEADPAIQGAIRFWRAVFAEQAPEWFLRCSRRGRSRRLQRSRVGKIEGGVVWWSPTGLWFLFARFAMAYASAWTGYKIRDRFSDPVHAFSYDLPVLLGNFTTLCSLLVLPEKLDSMMIDKGDPPLESKDINQAARLPFIFMVFWMVYGIVTNVSYNSLVYNDDDEAWAFFYDCTFVLETCASVPALSAILFTLSLDIARARKQLYQLTETARDQTLTIEQYRLVSEVVYNICLSWKHLLWILAGVALYNTVAMLVYTAHNDSKTTADDYLDDSPLSFNELEILTFLITVAGMGKEAALLFLLTSLVRLVNDEADDMVTDVFQWQLDGDTEETTEHEDSAAGLNELEQQMQHMITRAEKLESDQRKTAKKNLRLIILMEGADLTVLTSRDRKDRDGTIRRLISTKAGGIRFRVLGIRWTTKYVQALAASFVVTIAGILVQKYSI